MYIVPYTLTSYCTVASGAKDGLDAPDWDRGHLLQVHGPDTHEELLLFTGAKALKRANRHGVSWPLVPFSCPF